MKQSSTYQQGRMPGGEPAAFACEYCTFKPADRRSAGAAAEIYKPIIYWEGEIKKDGGTLEEVRGLGV